MEKILSIKTFPRSILLFPVMILLGAMLAIYADSPLLIIPLIGVLTLTSFAALDYALYILVAFLPFSFRFIMLSGTEMQVPTEPLLAIMSVALVLRWIVMKQEGSHVRFPFRLPLLLYGASLCLSMINTGDLYVTIKGSLRALAYMMLSVVVFNVITDRRRLKQLFIASIVPATIAVGWTVIFLIDRLEMWRWSSAYEGLPFTSYSHYGSFVAVIFLILLARTIFDRGIYDRVIWMFLLGFYGFAICLSFSRGVWLSLILAIGFLLLQRSGGVQYRKTLVIGGALVLLVVLLSVPYVSDLIISRVMTITNFSYGSNRERVLRWGAALMMFSRHPIVGCGYGSFALSFVGDPGLVGELIRFKMGAHSEYLQTLAETGLVGFSSWMWIIISFFLYGFRLLRKLRSVPSLSFWYSLVIGIMAAEMSLLVHFIVNNLMQADIIGVPFWLLIGLLPAVGNIVEKEESEGGTEEKS